MSRTRQRRVALKIVKPGMDSTEVLARFQTERQTLAMLNHPNIATIHDAGTTAEGRSFFVMELIEGRALTHYCDQIRLTIRQRLELFCEICDAVHHAHQKGVIHRDLKPSNILVSEVKDKPFPNVIDFGIAKVLSTDPGSDATLTRQGQLVGTPAYMSPEQAALASDGLPEDIDTRSDIYSLGVILYELLVGKLPYGDDQTTSSSTAQWLNGVRESDFPTPCSRFASFEHSSAGKLARARNTIPPS